MRSYGFRTEILVTPDQTQQLRRTMGAVRFSQNWALEYVKSCMNTNTPQSWSAISLHTAWREHRDNVAAWYSEVSKEAFQYGTQRAADGLHNFRVNKKHFGFPKKRKKGRNDSVQFTQANVMHVYPDNQVHLPRIGKITLREEFIVPEGSRITAMTVREKAGRWFISFKLREDKWTEPTKSTIGNVIGIDAGIGDTFATLSTGEKLENPRFYRKYEKKLRKRNKSIARKQKGSKNQQKAYQNRALLEMRTANKRNDLIHKFTTNLVKTHDEIVIEDLNLRGMQLRKGFKLGKSVSDVAWGEVRRQLEYKTSWYGKTLIIVSRWFPSSKICFECKYVNKKLKLSERFWTCPQCGTVLDRDLNAARNLAASSVVIAWPKGEDFSKSSGENVNPKQFVESVEVDLVEAGRSFCDGFVSKLQQK